MAYKEVLSKRENRTWQRKIEDLPNEYLKIKVGCLVWWFLNDAQMLNRGKKDRPFLDQLVRQYRPVIEYGYNEDELREALHRLGFPMKESWRMSKKPKTDRDYI
tara:strand:+ start:2672 stop:2983 length:312 start_codon:yes stop_codon:yes gene_type:complete